MLLGMGAAPAQWWKGSPVLANFKAQNPNPAASNPLIAAAAPVGAPVGLKATMQVAPPDDYVFPTGMSSSTKVAIGFGVAVAAFLGYVAFKPKIQSKAVRA